MIATDKENGLKDRVYRREAPKQLAAAFLELERRGYRTGGGFRTLGDEEDYVTYHLLDARTLRGTGQMYLSWQGNAAEILEVLNRHGLTPEWDESDRTRILITLTDQRTAPNRLTLQLGKPTHGIIPDAQITDPKPRRGPSLKVKRTRKRVIVLAGDLRVRSAGISPVAWTHCKPRPVMPTRRAQARALGSIRFTELESIYPLPAWMTKAAQARSAVLGVSVSATRTRHPMARQRVQVIMSEPRERAMEGSEVLWKT